MAPRRAVITTAPPIPAPAPIADVFVLEPPETAVGEADSEASEVMEVDDEVEVVVIDVDVDEVDEEVADELLAGAAKSGLALVVTKSDLYCEKVSAGMSYQPSESAHDQVVGSLALPLIPRQ